MKLNKYLIAAVLMVTGCNSGLKVHTSSVADPDQEKDNGNEPTPEFAGEFAFVRTYLQSRSAITLQLDSQIVQQGERFSLLNETTDVKLLDDEQAAYSLMNGSMYLAPNGAMLYNFAPAGFSSALVYGANTIRLNIDDESSPRYAMATLVLKDFDIFSPAMTHFGENKQVKDNFQGWLNTVSSPVVSSGDTTLTVGMPNIINR